MVEFYILERIIVNKKTTRIVYHYSGSFGNPLHYSSVTLLKNERVQRLFMSENAAKCCEISVTQIAQFGAY
jgi:hypothetical protein